MSLDHLECGDASPHLSRLQIVLANRVENVERLDGVVQRYDMMFHSAGDAVHVPRAEDAIFVTDKK
jgi:hypothetical protein